MKKAIGFYLFVLFVITICIIFFRNYYIQNKISKLSNNLTTIQENITSKINNEEIKFQNDEIGIIKIPSIEVEAIIKEGATIETMKYSVGHFAESSLWDGNVALASHNGGSYAHYFSRINELKNGEEIIYMTNMGERRYAVTENKIVEETNVKILEKTEENIITLVTCVKGKRSKRQCIIGKEIKNREE